MAKRTRQSELYMFLCILFFSCTAVKKIPEPKDEKPVQRRDTLLPVLTDNPKREDKKKEYSDITVQELMQKIERDEKFVFVDVRTQEEYAQGHIKGAILIPHTEIETRHKEISKGFT